jgi:uncharacterized iron-regulated protein
MSRMLLKTASISLVKIINRSVIPIQLILDIFNNMPETEGAFAEINEIIGQINERKIQMTELREQSEKTNREILDVSLEIDELLNKYCQMVFALKLK